jgi:hypothetical protein
VEGVVAGGVGESRAGNNSGSEGAECGSEFVHMSMSISAHHIAGVCAALFLLQVTAQALGLWAWKRGVGGTRM